MKKLFLILLFTISCNSQNNDLVLNINSSVEYNFATKDEYKNIIEGLKNFLKSKNSNPTNNPLWENDDFFSYPFLDILNVEEEKQGNFKPTLLAITKTDDIDEYIIKIGWFSYETETGIETKLIYNFLANKINGKYLFKNILNNNVKNWNKINIEAITFYHSPAFNFKRDNALSFNRINNELATYFDTDKISFTFFVCETNKSIMTLLGFDFEPTMFYSNQNGSVTYPHDNLIFSGNNSETNKHELIHLYTYKLFKNKNRIIDEGIATYLGGSKGLSYEYHLIKLKNHIQKNEINLAEELFNNNYVIDQDTSLMYTMGAFICDLVEKKGGKKLLFELLNSGENNEDLIFFLTKTFKINKQELDVFFKTKINH